MNRNRKISQMYLQNKEDKKYTTNKETAERIRLQQELREKIDARNKNPDLINTIEALKAKMAMEDKLLITNKNSYQEIQALLRKELLKFQNQPQTEILKRQMESRIAPYVKDYRELDKKIKKEEELQYKRQEAIQKLERQRQRQLQEERKKKQQIKPTDLPKKEVVADKITQQNPKIKKESAKEEVTNTLYKKAQAELSNNPVFRKLNGQNLQQEVKTQKTMEQITKQVGNKIGKAITAYAKNLGTFLGKPINKQIENNVQKVVEVEKPKKEEKELTGIERLKALSKEAKKVNQEVAKAVEKPTNIDIYEEFEKERKKFWKVARENPNFVNPELLKSNQKNNSRLRPDMGER